MSPPTVHYCVHSSIPWTYILSKMNTVHTLTILLSQPCLVLSSSLPQVSCKKPQYALLTYPMCATSTAHLMLVHLVIPIISGEEYKSWRSPLFISSYPPATSTLFTSNILLGILFSNTTMTETKFHTHTEQMTILNFIYLNISVFREQMWWQAANTIQTGSVCRFFMHKILII